MNWLVFAQAHLSSGRKISEKRFRSIFGVSTWTMTYLHHVYVADSPFQPHHLLWLFVFLKNYCLDDVGHHFFKNTNARTFQQTVFTLLVYLEEHMDEVMSDLFVSFILTLLQVEANFEREKDTLQYIIVDSTEVRINRPSISWQQKAVYSGYKKHTTLKYEVAISPSGFPISWNGPFPGPTADISIFRSSLQGKMREHGWSGLADGTYQGEPDELVVPPRPFRHLDHLRRQEYRILSRHRVLVENFFARMKSFHCLAHTWRHPLVRHRTVFKVVLCCVSIDMHVHPLRR